MDRSLIDQYAKGADDLGMAVRGLAPEDLSAYPVPGTWSIQEIVIHVADSDLVISDRMKRVIAEDNPQLIGFDESKFTKNLHYAGQSIEDAVSLFELNRRQMARVLAKLPDSAFARKGTHNERGPMTLEDLLRGAVNHLSHHLKFIVDKREKLGKIMW